MMRKTLLLMLAGSLGFAGYAQQVVFNVVAPANIAGSMPFTSNGDGSSWGLADLNDPADAILDTVVVVDDGTPGTNPQGIPVANEGCNPIQNNISGKIALIYRNSCAFGLKALNAQNAGAVGVIIVNNTSGLVNMNGGADGANVTIPVTFISNTEGATLRAELDAGSDVVVFIGNKTGYFANDLGFAENDALVPPSAAEFAPLMQTSADYSASLGFMARNYGSANQTNIVATATVTKNGDTVYTSSSTAFNLNAGDSLFNTFPNFELATYSNGLYELTYSLDLPGDEFPGDNSLTTGIYRNNDVFSYVALDTVTKLPAQSSGIRPATFTTSYTSALAFMHPSAERAKLQGVYFAASTDATDSLTGKILEINVYEWNDAFTDISDPNFGFNSLSSVYYIAHTYTADDQNVFQYAELNPPLQLTNNQRYLICVTSYELTLFIAHSDAINYDLNLSTAGFQPIQGLEVDGTWYGGGWASPTYPAIVLDMIPSGIGLNEEEKGELVAYPNPTVGKVQIPWPYTSDVNRVDLMDMTGRTVKEGADFQFEGGRISLDLSDVQAGTYFMQINRGSENASTVRIMVTK